MKKAVVVLSGGLDSSTCLYVAKAEGYELYAITFLYGQLHIKEVESARRVAEAAGVKEHRFLDLPRPKGSALTDNQIIVPTNRTLEDMSKEIPVTYVPARNTLFLAFALQFAEEVDADVIFIGITAIDYCLPGSTDIIVKGGIKKLSDLKVGEEVISLGVTGLEWKPVTMHKQSPPRKTLLRIIVKGGNQYIEVTDNHHMVRVATTRKHRLLTDKRLEFVEAQELKKGDYLVLPCQEFESSIAAIKNIVDYKELLSSLPGAYTYVDKKDVWHKKENKTKRYVSYSAFIRLIGWYVTEGWLTYRGRKRENKNGVYISQSYKKNRKKFELIYADCLEAGVNPHRDTKYGSIYFSSPLAHYFREFCGNSSREKRLPDFILALDNKHLSMLLSVLIAGDGTQYQEEGFDYYSTSKKLIQQVAYIAIRLGYRVTTSKRLKGNLVVHAYRGRKRNQRKILGGALVQIRQIQKVSCKEDLYDLTVKDNHTLVAGQQGFFVVSQSGYPDARPEFFSKWQELINLATKKTVEGGVIELKAPVLQMYKAEIVEWGMELGVSYELTQSCYNGRERACGVCDSCKLRLKGFREAGVKDPLEYETDENR